MSTTRPLLGMKRITELTCSEPPGGRLSAPVKKQQQDALTVDEFTVPEAKQEELKCVKPRVEQVFEVAFTIIGLLDPTGAHGTKASRQIWLQLKGKREDVSKAKEYVKGLCDPELQKVEVYPADMHCIFVGARGLFLDQLLRDTSAEVAVLEPGRLRLLGRAEAVVMAQSRVQQFVALFQENKSLPGDTEPAVKRAFKTFVEERADKYAMELLLLPSALKEELLGLACGASAPAGPPNPPPEPPPPTPGPLPHQHARHRAVQPHPGRHLRGQGGAAGRGAGDGLVLHRRRGPRQGVRQRHLWGRRPPDDAVLVLDSSELSDEGADGVSPETNFKCLVNFFRTMGYQQEVVERVVKEAGQREDTFLLLERIVEETGWPPPTPPAPRRTGIPPGHQEIIVIADDDGSEGARPGPGAGPGAGAGVAVKARPAARANFAAVAKMDYLSRGTRTLGPERTVGPARVPPPSTPIPALAPAPSPIPQPARCEPQPPKAAPLTGVSRFQQSLRTPYRLTLQNEPGNPGLRHIIIDGSNVAMMHGLHRFFSCRGIAIAVETFWKRGHREITVFVPQWRQKRDPNITEQHFLSQLEDLRLLSFTPSREVCGQRICSHDDRFLLHLAEKTGGVIVTNDNLRDFVDTSEAWKQIIKERLLQFTFVEDHFLIPDDPLGKHGPQLEDFLRKDFRHSPVTAPSRPELRVTPPVYVQALQSAPRPSLAPRPGPPLPRRDGGPEEAAVVIFPDQRPRIDRILSENPYMRDLNALSGLLLG
ncbi:hypothetical protein ANANG_G00099430 [Anguilla anguilla]|uniref:NEDD4-binding protein 1 n=1 Tax=Anguilla anguilla TaxID=7936 RepID=A0A9D3S0Z6_ANGAN|nr:hypothetical protein ANANG_G00099430 [Anguilla anguilla]